ncbi:MAG TPA: class I SAM-dependent methyltransferase [Pseudoneobacillus sp.]|nr:class I SAM-dependent methyltransferase [Pseudoneobacillus sp.]
MNNRWNQLIYRMWAPIYDVFFNRGSFRVARKKVFTNLPFKQGDQILFVGVGTGADLEYIPHHEFNITAIDYSYDMLEKARRKYSQASITFQQMDAEHLNLPADQFDFVIGSLILSVVPNPYQALHEMMRVTKPGGQIILFDKFAPEGASLSFFKKILRPVIQLLGTDIGLSFGNIIQQQNRAHILSDEDMMFQGMYRKIVLEKRTSYAS